MGRRTTENQSKKLKANLRRTNNHQPRLQHHNGKGLQGSGQRGLREDVPGNQHNDHDLSEDLIRTELHCAALLLLKLSSNPDYCDGYSGFELYVGWGERVVVDLFGYFRKEL
jgi:hypothetical protein